MLTQGRGSRVPVGVANANVGCWRLMVLRGHVSQLPQHGGEQEAARAGWGCYLAW